MVETNISAADQTIAFFDQLFLTVPPVYRQIDREHLAEVGTEDAAAVPGKKPTKKKNVSLVELNEKAHERVESIRRANAIKSVQKIKELTVEHQKTKKDGKTTATTAGDPDIIDDENSGEESKVAKGKSAQKNGKKNGKGGAPREPLEKGEKKVYASKDLVSKSKLANKRS